MKTSRVGLIVIMLAVIGSAQMGFGADNIYVQQPTTYEGPDFVPGQIIVQFRPGVPEDVIARINEKNKARVAHTSRHARFKVLTFPEAIPPQAMVNIYTKNPNVEYAELNYVAHAFMVPNDPLYSPYQWHLKNIGMEQAWDISTGAGVTVAVVDTGVRSGGPDGIGTIIAGWDFVNNDNDPTDDEGHGTHVAGTIAQSTKNSVGVAGVAYDCSIMAVKVLDAGGSGAYAWIADGIRYAADNGAKVINMSLGGPVPSITLENALAHAHGEGVTIVCSSGNDSATTVGYPAAYDAYCIAVGATRYDEAVADYSNGGSALDLTAPGGDVTIDQNGDGYGDGVLQETYRNGTWGYWFYQGTSMASPHVAGVAALLISQGTYTTPSAIQDRLQSTAKDKGPVGWDIWYGWGIVDAAAALGGGTEPPVTLSSIDVTPASATVAMGGTQQYLAMGTYSDGEAPVNITSSVTWRSSKTRVASIDSTGLATGVRKGTTYITATLDGVTSNQATLTVSRTAPTSTPKADFTWTADELAVAFTDNSTDDGSIVAWSWDFGDGGSSTEQNPSHTYAASGTYTVTLTVTDNDDATDTTGKSVGVTEPSTGSKLRADIVRADTDYHKVARDYFIWGYADVLVTDENGDPVEGATVTGDWTGAVASPAFADTNSDGIATLLSDEFATRNRKLPLTFTLTITSVEKEGYTYDSEYGLPRCTVYWP